MVGRRISMASTKTYYQLLEVPKDADQNAIKASYRRKAKMYHPDANGGSSENETLFKEISEAYVVLSDEDKRAEYDKTLAPILRDDVYLWCYDIPNPVKWFLAPLGIFFMLVPSILHILSLVFYIPAVLVVMPFDGKEKKLTKSVIVTHQNAINGFKVFGKIGSSMITIT
jgi:curved DNA-binding protein CbpA